MKKLPLLLLPLLLLSACDRDPYPLDLRTFHTTWFDDDDNGVQSLGDALEFDIQLFTTDPDTDDQVITEWEFSYFVNGAFAGVLNGDNGLASNNVNMRGEVLLDRLEKPGPGVLGPGDRLEFRFWAIDNRGTQTEQFFEFGLEN